MRRVLALCLVLLAVGAGACDDASDRPRAHARWHRVGLPVPPGPDGRLLLRDATTCGDTWYVVGGVVAADGSSRPALWTSPDGSTWRAASIRARDTYAQESLLASVACHADAVVVVGAKPGGAHGNPRTSSWYLRDDGTLVDVVAPFELFGGPDAIAVGQVAAGPGGFLIAGSRRTGAAIWSSPDGHRLTLLDDDPALANDATTQTAALDAAPDGDGWTVVGRAQRTGRAAPGPLAWTSSGVRTWTRTEVPAGTRGFADLERVVRDGDDLVAAGVRDDRFGTWRRHDGRWRAEHAFGAVAEGSAPRFVSGLAARADGLVVAVSDGARYRLWAGDHDGTWTEVGVPVNPVSTGDTALTVTADRDGRVLLLVDDGRSGRAWIGDRITLRP